jgi:membrane-associated phospholipid phosphatase
VTVGVRGSRSAATVKDVFPSETPTVSTRQPEDVLSRRHAVMGLTVLVVLFGALTGALALGAAQLDTIDQSVARWGYDLTYGRSGLSAWWRGVAFYGQPIVLRLLMVIIALLVVARGRRWYLAAWLIAVAVAENVIAPLTKYALNRPRPHWLHPITVEHSLSYPSGHATAAGMFLVATTLLALTTTESSHRRRVGIATVALVYAVVSADRVFLGVHYLSDVIGGNLLGAAISLIGWVAMLHWTRGKTNTFSL